MKGGNGGREMGRVPFWLPRWCFGVDPFRRSCPGYSVVGGAVPIFCRAWLSNEMISASASYLAALLRWSGIHVFLSPRSLACVAAPCAHPPPMRVYCLLCALCGFEPTGGGGVHPGGGGHDMEGPWRGCALVLQGE